MAAFVVVLSLLSTLFLPVLATTQFFTSLTAPVNLAEACNDALLANVSCSNLVTALAMGSTAYHPVAVLEQVCTQDCDDALAEYQANINSACADDTWSGYDNDSMPVTVVPDLIRYQFNLTCLMDSGRYCNNVAALAAEASGQDVDSGITGGSLATNISSISQTLAGSNSTDPCDMCFIKNLRLQAGSPYYDGPALRESSIYESKTSSCSVTGYPLATTTLGWLTTSAPSTPTPTSCAGKQYAIKAGDNCHSISKNQGIGTAWLLQDNNLKAYCANFPKNGTLCLTHTCKTYTVHANDTCSSISRQNSVSESQLKSWNTVINVGCNNLNRLVGTEICVESPGQKYAYQNTTVVASTAVTTVAPVPTDVAVNTTTRCSRYYDVVEGDYCNQIIVKYGISMSDFIFLNPSINENCTNLYINESYCVQPVGDINTYPGRAGATSTTSLPPVTATEDLPDATWTPAATNSTKLPIATGTRKDCSDYFPGSDFQMNMTGSIFGSTCVFAAKVFGIDVEDLEFWNPSLGNASLANCTFASGLQYCSRWYDVSPPVAAEPTPSLFPIRDGVVKNCTEYQQVYDGWTCETVEDAYDVTFAQFYAYNPVIGKDCSSLWPNYQYCMRTASYVEPSSNLTATTPGVTKTSTLSSTSRSSAGTATTVTSKAGSTPASMASTKAPTTSGTTSSSAPPPTKTQENSMPSNCDKWAQAQSDDSCSKFAERNGITTDELYKWNTVLGEDGKKCDTEMWATYYYCTGVDQ